jgi:hypothetical protein
MSDEEFEDVETEIDDDLVEDEPDVEDLDEDLELADDDLVADAVEDDEAPPVETPVAEVPDEDDEGMDLDEELHPDDVEAPLDALLQEKTAAQTLEDDEEELEEEDDADGDDRGDGPTKIVPRRPGEFVCSSCFLVLPRNQLVDEKRKLCRDCA